LFDASAVVNLVKRGSLKPFIRGATLDLAVYESLNAIWKEHKMLSHIDLETARTFVEILKGLFDSIPLESVKGYETEVFELASKEGLTVYDAAYLYVAMKDGLTLVSDDERLLSKATRYVKALKTAELLQNLTPRGKCAGSETP